MVLVKAVGGAAAVVLASCATWSAVSGASPVIMKTECAESTRAPITIAESERVLQANATNPSKARFDSTRSRGIDEAAASSAAATSLCASASTRMPCSASERYADSYQTGTVVLDSNVSTASGEPFTSPR